MIEVGKKAPDFRLKSDEGRDVSIKDFLGRRVVLYFYQKDGTSGCTQGAMEFRDLSKSYERAGAVILLLSCLLDLSKI